MGKQNSTKPCSKEVVTIDIGKKSIAINNFELSKKNCYEEHNACIYTKNENNDCTNSTTRWNNIVENDSRIYSNKFVNSTFNSDNFLDKSICAETEWSVSILPLMSFL